VVGDLIPIHKKQNSKSIIKMSKLATLLIGVYAILLASTMDNVLSLMFYAYAFMVSGLLVAVVAAIILNKRHPLPALESLITGRSVSIGLIIADMELPYGLDANVFGLSAAVLSYGIVFIFKS